LIFYKKKLEKDFFSVETNIYSTSMALKLGISLDNILILLFVVFFCAAFYQSFGVREGMATASDLTNFTGLAVFSSKSCTTSDCTTFAGVVKQLFQQYPGQVLVFDCSDPSDPNTSALMSKYKIKTCSEVLLFSGGVSLGFVPYRNFDALGLVIKKITPGATTSTTTTDSTTTDPTTMS
jgi:hypothetical protein